MITVFYDGKCGLCRSEIEHYKRISSERVFVWHDITVDSSPAKSLGISYSDGLKRLHAQDENGRLHVGVDAFLLIWRQIPRWRVLAKIVNLPLIRSTANITYDIFAKWRFNQLSHCQIAMKADKADKK